jgi:hypothetical protein
MEKNLNRQESSKETSTWFAIMYIFICKDFNYDLFAVAFRCTNNWLFRPLVSFIKHNSKVAVYSFNSLDICNNI